MLLVYEYTVHVPQVGDNKFATIFFGNKYFEISFPIQSNIQITHLNMEHAEIIIGEKEMKRILKNDCNWR